MKPFQSQAEVMAWLWTLRIGGPKPGPFSVRLAPSYVGIWSNDVMTFYDPVTLQVIGYDGEPI